MRFRFLRLRPEKKPFVSSLGAALLALVSVAFYFVLMNTSIAASPGAERDRSPSLVSGVGKWLSATGQIDKDSITIRRKALELTEGLAVDRDRALRLHRFVRDEVEFGWERSFYAMKASEVLQARRGFCNTKATLFIALLRAADIPARQHFVDLRSDVLYGLVNTGGRYVDHSYTEVFLEGRWLGVDSYVIDRPLYERALAKLESTGRQLGYGVHQNGTIDWDGRSDSFVQFVDDGTVDRLSPRDHGTFIDVDDFYASVNETWNRRTGLRAIALHFFLPAANHNVMELRAD